MMKEDNKTRLEQDVESPEENIETPEVETVEHSEPVEEDKSDPQKKIEELEQKCADLADKNLRMMAEFENYRRRTQKEKLELMDTAGEQIFKQMLPLVDDFERAQKAMQTTDDIDAIREGISLIYNKFVGFLAANKVTEIETENADFSTELHEAVTTFPAASEDQKGKVIDCTQKGYKLADKVIRYAKVVVGQ